MPARCCLALEEKIGWRPESSSSSVGPSERHDHRPGSSSDSTEKPLIEDALEESEPGRERQTERERRWNMVGGNEISSQTVK